MPLHFSREEFAGRLALTREAMAAAGLDGMLLFHQTSRYWLTGYDSFGFVLFECLVLHADGRMVLLTRPTDVPAVSHTSIVEDVRVWHDGSPTAPIDGVRDIVREQRLTGGRLGVEFHSYGLNASYGHQLRQTLEAECDLVDASELVTRLRLVKSDTELVFAREAGKLANRALAEAQRLAVAGTFEGDILAAAQGEIFRGGGDYPGNEFTIASGRGAMLPRYFSGRRHLDAKDQLMLQLGGAYRRYHASLMVTVCVGGAIARQREMHSIVRACLERAHEQLKPGCRLADLYADYKQSAASAGFGDGILSACGYSLGAAYHPTWMDWPWLHPRCEVIAAPGMIFYIHMILLDHRGGYAMALADTSVVTSSGCEQLTHPPMDMIET